MSRFIVTVNRDAIDKGLAEAIRVEDTRTGEVTHHSEVALGESIIRYGPARRDGARVWIETENAGDVLH